MRFIFSILFILLSCSSDNTGYDGNGNLSREEDGSLFPFTSFNTRLTPELLISGRLCQGEEVVESEGRTYLCERDSWLVVVDDINFCTPEGCTEVEVRPIIAGLLSRNGGAETQFFEIVPEIPVRGRAEDILEDVLLRYTVSTEPVVVFD